MKYFSRSRLENPALIWSLFTDLKEVSREIHVEPSDIIRSASAGSINLRAEFNLKGYCATSNRREVFADYKRSQNCPPLLSGFEDSDTYRPTTFGVVEDHIEQMSSSVPKPKNTFSIGDFSPEFRRSEALKELKHLSDKYESWGIKLDIAVPNALKGVPTAKQQLSELFGYEPDLKEQLLSIIRDGFPEYVD